MEVTFSPEAQLGRMIYKMNCNAYEMAECTISNLKNYDIIDIGEYNKILYSEIVGGSISGIFTNTEKNKSNSTFLIKNFIMEGSAPHGYYKFINKLSGKRYYDQFDYIKWFNNKL